MFRRFLPAVVPFLLTAGPAGAAEPAGFNPDAAAKAVAPFVDDQTLAIARLDVERFDPAAMARQVVKVVPDAGPALDEVRKGLDTLKGLFTRAGGRDVYLLARVTRPTEPFVGVVPLRQGADADALLK